MSAEVLSRARTIDSATIHANSAADVPSRVEGLAMAAGLSRDAAHSQLASALDVVIHLGRGPDGRRRIRELAVLEAGPAGVRVVSGVGFATDGAVVPGPALERLSALVEP